MTDCENRLRISIFPPMAVQKQHLWKQIDRWGLVFIYFPKLDTQIEKEK